MARRRGGGARTSLELLAVCAPTRVRVCGSGWKVDALRLARLSACLPGSAASGSCVRAGVCVRIARCTHRHPTQFPPWPACVCLCLSAFGHPASPAPLGPLRRLAVERDPVAPSCIAHSTSRWLHNHPITLPPAIPHPTRPPLIAPRDPLHSSPWSAAHLHCIEAKHHGPLIVTQISLDKVDSCSA